MHNDKTLPAKPFVEWIIKRLAEGDTAMRAALRRADNPATDHYAWKYLETFGIDVTNSREAKIYSTVAAALARANPKEDGEHSIGKALYDTGSKNGDKAIGNSAAGDNPAGEARLNRLLGCATAEEACAVLRPVLQLVDAKAPDKLSYSKLISDLVWFGDRVKARWAHDYFSYLPSDDPGKAKRKKEGA